MHRVNLGFTRLVTPASHILLAITLAITAMRGMHRLLSVLLCETLKDFQRLLHFPTRIETKGQLEVKESMLVNTNILFDRVSIEMASSDLFSSSQLAIILYMSYFAKVK